MQTNPYTTNPYGGGQRRPACPVERLADLRAELARCTDTVADATAARDWDAVERAASYAELLADQIRLLTGEGY